jgi:argininosuccinate lyase
VAALPPCDAALLASDLATNMASALALFQAGVLSENEIRTLANSLLDLGAAIEKGEFLLDPELEDVHINIENTLRERIGDLAGKLHSGRSRNDQVACDLRLWHRDRILDHLNELTRTARVLLDLAEREKDTLLPGFSHHQRAFITTFGHALASYAQAQLRDLDRGLSVYTRVNRCPLGAAAGFGTSWPLDRNLLADTLGFDGVVENSLDAVASRLEVEQEVAAWLSLWMGHCSTLAQDLILYSMEEFKWVRLAVETTTGSSIMPQKRNPDFAEVIKGKTSVVHGGLVSLLSLGKGQPSGYHRDSQYSKPLGQDLWREVAGVPEVLRLVLETLDLDRDKMLAATVGGFLEAAEWADVIAQSSGLPFRDIYSAIGLAVDRCRGTGRLDLDTVNSALEEKGLGYQVEEATALELESPTTLLARRNSLGSPNPDRVSEHVAGMREELNGFEGLIEKKKADIAEATEKRLQRLKSLAGR